MTVTAVRKDPLVDGADQRNGTSEQAGACPHREELSRPVDQRATLFFPPAVLLTTLGFATVLAVVKSWGRIRGGRTPGVQRR